MKLFQSIRNRYCATNAHDRIAFRGRRCETCDQIRAAWPRSNQCHSRFSGHPANAACYERRVLLMPADYGFDLRVHECVEDLIDLRSRYAEDVFDSVRLQTFHLQVGTCLRRWLCVRCAHFFSPSALARAAVGSLLKLAFKKSSVSGSTMW